MGIIIKQFSSLDRLYDYTDLDRKTTENATILKGQHFSYQVAVYHEGGNIENRSIMKISVESPIADCVKVYCVKHVFADYPHCEIKDTNYEFNTPKMVPDLLMPLEEQRGYANLTNLLCVFWVEVCVKNKEISGTVPINLNIEGIQIEAFEQKTKVSFEETVTFTLDILDKEIPSQNTKFTQWFHVDCIADVHGEEVYSERHWTLIEKYMKMAADLGINVIFTPVLTPSLDIAPGMTRPCVQLVKIDKVNGTYQFDFSLLHRYIEIAKKCGINYFEINHFFTQWGCRFSPVIEVYENKEKTYPFGWHVNATDPSYKEFLENFVPKLIDFLKKEGVVENCYFHISDEPSDAHIKYYENAYNILKPLIGNCKTLDALSHVEFYEKGLVDTPVCTNDHLDPFIEKNVKGLWAYYCNAQREQVSNRFLAMPAYRNRIIGLQLYKYGIEGFLHWGYNFYYSQYSFYEINPYLTSAADGTFCAGDPYSVYPGKNGPIPSVRAFVFREALEDIELCRMLEKKIGKEAVIKLIEEEAGMEITFKKYPLCSDFINSVVEKIKLKLKEV